MKNSHPFLKALLLVSVLAFAYWSEKAWASQDDPEAALQFQSREPRLVVQVGHVGQVTAAAFSSDGRLVVTVGVGRAVILWDVSTGRELRRLPVEKEVESVAFVPNGDIIFTQSKKVLTLWHAKTGKKITDISSADGGFSSSGGLLLTNHSTTPNVYRALNGEELHRYAKPGEVQASTFSPDGKFVLLQKNNKTASLWNMQTGAEERQFDGADAKFSPDGRFVITRMEEMALWNASTGELIRRFAGGHAEVSPDGRSVITSIGEESRFGNKPMNTNPSRIKGESILFEASTGKELRRIPGSKATFSPDNRLIVTEGSGGPILWDAATGQILKSFDNLPESISKISFAANGHYFLAQGDKTRKGDTAGLWEAKSLRKIRQVYVPKITSVVFSPDSRYLLAGDLDSGARLWELVTGLEVRRFEGLTSSVDNVRFANSGQFIEANSVINLRATIGFSGHIVRALSSSAHQWEVATGQRSRYFEALAPAVSAAGISADGRFVVTAGTETAQLWEVSTGRLLRTFEGHTDRIWSVKFSSDDRHLLTASSDGTVRLWEVASGRELRRFEHTDEIALAELSRDGHFVLTAGSLDGTVRLWDAATGRELRQFVNAGENFSIIASIAFSADGRFIIAGVFEVSEPGTERAKVTSTARIWKAVTGKEVGRFEHPGVMVSAAFSPDGKRVLTGCEDITARQGIPILTGCEEKARLWDASSGKLIRSYSEPNALASVVALSPDGRYVMANGREVLFPNGSTGFRACLWDANTGRVIKLLTGHATGDTYEAFGASDIAFSGDGHSVLTLSEKLDLTDYTSSMGMLKSLTEKSREEGEVEPPISAQVWDVATGKEIRSLGRDRDDPQEIEFSPDGETVVVRSNNFAAVQLLDANTGLELRRLAGPSKDVTDVAYSPDGRFVVAGSEDGAAYLWETTTGKLLRRFEEFTSDSGGWGKRITSLSFYADNSRVGFIVGGDDVILANTSTGKQINKFRTLLPEDFQGDPTIPHVTSLAVSPDNKYIATGDDDGNIQLFDGHKGGRHRLEGTGQGITSIKFSPDNRLIASTQDDRKVALWSLDTYKEVDGLWNDEAVKNIEFAPTGRLLLTSSGTAIRLWNVKTQRFVRQMVQNKSVTATAFSRNGSLIATGSEDGTVRVWQASSGAPVQVLKGHTAKVIAVAFSSEGSLVSASEDNTIRSWELANGVQSSSMSVKRVEDEPLVLSSDGRLAVTADAGNVVRLWNVVAGQESGIIGSRFHSVNSVTFSPNGRFILTGSTEWKFQQGQDNIVDTEPAGTHTRLWDVTTGLPVQTYVGESGTSYPSFSPDGKYVLSKISFLPTSPFIGKAVIWETATGKKLREFQFKDDSWTASLSMSADARWILAGTEVSDSTDQSSEDPGNFDKDNSARLFDAETGKVIQTLTGHAAPVGTVALSADDKYILTGSADGATGFWLAKTGKLLCRLVSFRDGSWVVVTPDGRFDTNNLERIAGLHWVMPDDPLTPLPVEIFMRPYYEPRLLPRLLADDDFREVPQFGGLNRVQPKVTITEVKKEGGSAATVTVEVENVQHAYQREKNPVVESGAKDLRLFRDGQLVSYRDGDLLSKQQTATTGCEPVAGSAPKKCRAVFEHVRLPQQEGVKDVEFSAYAFNTSDVKSETFRFPFKFTPELPPRKGRVYLITMGVSKYENPAWDLKFAANDAHLVDEVVAGKLRDTGDYDDVVNVTLTSEEKDSNGQKQLVKSASKENFKKIMRLLAGEKLPESETREIPNAQKIEKATPEDVVMIFYSSHGYRDTERFYLLPYDTGTGQGRDPEVVAPHAISSDDLYQWLRDIDAGDMVLVIDACHAAAVTGKEFKPGPMGSRGMGQLAYDKGMRILAATQPDTTAVEVSDLNQKRRIQHGLLTYALVQDGLVSGLADTNGDKSILLAEWLEYGVTDVPKLYEEAVRGHDSNADQPITRSQQRDAGTVRFISRGNGDTSTQQPSLFDFTSKLRRKRQLVVQR